MFRSVSALSVLTFEYSLGMPASELKALPHKAGDALFRMQGSTRCCSLAQSRQQYRAILTMRCPNPLKKASGVHFPALYNCRGTVAAPYSPSGQEVLSC
jgi:hypothetical protein